MTDTSDATLAAARRSVGSPHPSEHAHLSPDGHRRLVELACQAPSFHNSQPWLWRITHDGLELYADQSRRLEVEDPYGRSLLISCGSVLHHARVVVAAWGMTATVERFPLGPGSTLLARLRIDATHRTPTDPDVLDLVANRCTDRRRFTSWPVPPERLAQLSDAALEQGAYAVPVTDVTSRFRFELLAHRARTTQASDARVQQEQRRWTDRGDRDGVPSNVLPHRTAGDRGGRFGAGVLPQSNRGTDGTEGVLVLGAADDGPEAWVRTGEGLSALWLEATRQGLSVVPQSQPIEVERTRAALQREVLGGLLTPHLVVRIGWQAISRDEIPRTPRRPVGDVLRD